MAGLDRYIVDLVRRDDRGRFVTAMFAPEDRRAGLLAVTAFNAEIARIPLSVSEPILGQMKLQWWRDTLTRLAENGVVPAGHPIAEALRRDLPENLRGQLHTLVDARDGDFETDQARVAAESAPLAELALAVLGVTDTESSHAARHAGLAYGLALNNAAPGALEHIAAARALRGVVDRRSIPVLLWTTLAQHRVDHGSARLPVLRLTWNAWRGRY